MQDDKNEDQELDHLFRHIKDSENNETLSEKRPSSWGLGKFLGRLDVFYSAFKKAAGQIWNDRECRLHGIYILVCGFLCFLTYHAAYDIGRDAGSVAESGEPSEAEPGFRTPQVFPPQDANRLADPEIRNEFFHTSFDWSSGPVDWESTSRKERGELLFFGSYVRESYKNNTVRICENYYDPQHIRYRWQEEFRNGEWVDHGPCLHWHNKWWLKDDGVFSVLGDLYWKLNGEKHGTFWTAYKDGKIVAGKTYKYDFPLPRRDLSIEEENEWLWQALRNDSALLEKTLQENIELKQQLSEP